MRALVNFPPGSFLSSLFFLTLQKSKYPINSNNFLTCTLFYNVRVWKEGKLYYMNKTELGGSIPTFLVNYMNPGVSYEEMTHICEILEKESKSSN